MKKAMLLLSATFIVAVTVSAQKSPKEIKKSKDDSKLYGRIGLGYAFGQARDGVQTQTAATMESVTKYSNGAGLNLNLAAGYKVTHHVAVELGAYIGIAPKKTTINYDNGTTSLEVQTVKAKTPLYLIPALVLSTDTKPLDIYMRAGLVLPLLAKTGYEYTSTSGGNVTENDYTVKSSFGVGFQGAVGAKYAVTSKIGLWLEVTGISMNRWAKSSEMTKYTQNGTDHLSQLTTHDKKVNYVTSYTSGGGGYNPDEPDTELTTPIPYSNIGFALGVSLSL